MKGVGLHRENYSIVPVSFTNQGVFQNPLKVVNFIFVRTFGQSGIFKVGTKPGGEDVVPGVQIQDNAFVDIGAAYQSLYYSFDQPGRVLVYTFVLNMV